MSTRVPIAQIGTEAGTDAARMRSLARRAAAAYLSVLFLPGHMSA
jgi:hypothetical protein